MASDASVSEALAQAAVSQAVVSQAIAQAVASHAVGNTDEPYSAEVAAIVQNVVSAHMDEVLAARNYQSKLGLFLLYNIQFLSTVSLNFFRAGKKILSWTEVCHIFVLLSFALTSK